jgi:DNA-binding response OmpR family regulator
MMAKGSILLVDDDGDILFHFQNIIKKEGYLVDAASYGKKAIENVQENKYDLAILDIMLPDMRGDALALELRKIDPSLRIIFITGFSYMDECIKTLDIGISELLLKPITQFEIIQAIQNNLNH